MSLGFAPADGKRYLAFSCEVQLETPDGKRDGPAVTVWAGIPADPELSLQEIERGALDRTHEMFLRMSTVTSSELLATYQETQKRAASFWSNDDGADAP
jgi:hypothetical protein